MDALNETVSIAGSSLIFGGILGNPCLCLKSTVICISITSTTYGKKSLAIIDVILLLNDMLYPIKKHKKQHKKQHMYQLKNAVTGIAAKKML